MKKQSPLFYAHVVLERGGRIALPATHEERAVYVVSGAIETGGQKVEALQLAVFTPGGDTTVRATTPRVLMLLGGAPVGERFIEWNFVSSSAERIAQAKADWRAARLKLPDLDNKEFIPLPPEDGAAH